MTFNLHNTIFINLTIIFSVLTVFSECNIDSIDFKGKLYKSIFYNVYDPNDIDTSIVPKKIKERFQTFLNRYHKYELKSYNQKNVDFPKTFQLKKKLHLKRIIISLINIEGIDTFANSFIEKAPISYEWEGMSDGPLKEAKYAEEFLLKYPQTPMTDFLYLFLLHRIKCGYECLLFEKKEEEYKKYIEKYTTYLQKIMSISDDLIKLIACDIDKQKYIYLPPQKLIKDKKE